MQAKLPVAQHELSTLAQKVIEMSSASGATAAEVAISAGVGMSVSVRLGEVDTLEYQRDRSLGVTVYFDQRRGSASTSDFSHEAVRQTVDKACSFARFTAKDEASGLADEADMADTIMDLELHHPWDISPEKAIELATECEDAARSFDPRIRNSEGASVNSHQTARVYANSHQFVGGFDSSSHGISCSVLAGDDASSMERDYWYTSARDASDLLSAKAVGEEAARRALSRLGARKLSTRNAPVLYPPELARGLIGHFLGAITGSSQYRKASFLLDAKGQQVFPEFYNMTEDPHIPKAFGSVPIDAEGVATYPRELVTQGVVNDYIMGSYSARRLGLKTTANAGGIQNMLVVSGESDFDGLIRKMDTGLVVTELIGQGVNLITGDYSRGAAGFWVEGGNIVHPVHEITVAGNLKDIYANLVEVGCDIDIRSKVRCGSILVESLTIAGN